MSFGEILINLKILFVYRLPKQIGNKACYTTITKFDVICRKFFGHSLSRSFLFNELFGSLS